MKLKNKIIPSVLCAAFSLPFTSAIADVVHQDDVIVVGSLCAGFDCVNGENFGFDTIRLKENNLRIKFIDTSGSSSFPTNDWQITINDSANGGVNKFSIEDIDGGTTPFTILASAPNDSLYISANGYIGLGTSTPLVQVHVKEGNSPTLRLEQDTSAGFAEQTWDLGGNETNFFIRDATNGSKLPFRIVPNAPNASIYVAADGDVGFETDTPDGQFDVAHSANANNHAFLIGTDSAVGVNIDNGQIPLGLFDVQTTGGVSRFTVEADGDVGLSASSPSGRFDIRNLDGSTPFFNVDSTGKIGVGTLTPNAQMDINSGDFLVRSGGIRIGELLTSGSSSVIDVSLSSKSATGKHNLISMDTTDVDTISQFEFHSAAIPKWFLSSRNSFLERASTLDRLSLYNEARVELFTVHQSGGIFIGTGSPNNNTSHALEAASGAHLTTGGVWTNVSSRAAKKDIVDITLAVAESALAALNPVTFEYKAEPNETYAGFIAEDVPELVATNNRKNLVSMDIVAVLTKVLQQQQKTIKALGDRIQKLEKH